MECGEEGVDGDESGTADAVAGSDEDAMGIACISDADVDGRESATDVEVAGPDSVVKDNVPIDESAECGS